jgi:hypothetical protein
MAARPQTATTGGVGWTASEADVRAFEEDGFLMVPNLFSSAESELLHRIAKADPNGQKSPDGKQPGMWLFADVDKEDIWNGIVRSERVAGTTAKLLGDDVYVYHYKMAMKEAANAGVEDAGTVLKDGSRGKPGRSSNNWEWHQDYGCRAPSTSPPPVLPVPPAQTMKT